MPEKATFKRLAYTINTVQDLPYATYRLARGFLFKRAGAPVAVIPQFKGVQIATNAPKVTAANPQTPAQTATNAFSTPTIPVSIQWKVR